MTLIKMVYNPATRKLGRFQVLEAYQKGSFEYYITPQGNYLGRTGNFIPCRNFNHGLVCYKSQRLLTKLPEKLQKITINTPLNAFDCGICYRAITSVCQEGVSDFIDKISELKPRYTMQEVIEMTQGLYGNASLRAYFSNEPDDISRFTDILTTGPIKIAVLPIQRRKDLPNAAESLEAAFVDGADLPELPDSPPRSIIIDPPIE